MNIVVCLRGAGSGAQPLARNDRRAIDLARALGDEHHVTALLAGTKDEAQPLEAALAIGIDRAARIASAGLQGADFHTLGQILARAILSLQADLVLAGARADTDGLGALSASVARHMALPHLANVETLELLTGAERAPHPGSALAVTVRGGGRKRRLGITLPMVMSVASHAPELANPPESISPPRRPGGASAIEVISLADPEATVLRRRTEIVGANEPSQRASRTVASAAELLADLMKR
jgi:electron transfer flavoprotein alpha/beta subunit